MAGIKAGHDENAIQPNWETLCWIASAHYGVRSARKVERRLIRPTDSHRQKLGELLFRRTLEVFAIALVAPL